MNPFFFGSSARQLFGIHHPPEGGQVRDAAVLLCAPLGHEYIAAHRPLQQLATRLARAGFHALRFDFSGCGDSAGVLEEATLEHWLDDVATALQELRDCSGARRINVVGLRLGAALAALAAARGDGHGLHAAVLWEPVVCGASYLEELAAVQADWVRRTFPRPKPETLDWPDFEVLGFGIAEPLRQGLAGIDLTALPRPPAARVLLMENEHDGAYADLQQRLVELGAAADRQCVAAEPCWQGHGGGTIALVPVDVNKAITTWLAEAQDGGAQGRGLQGQGARGQGARGQGAPR